MKSILLDAIQIVASVLKQWAVKTPVTAIPRDHCANQPGTIWKASIFCIDRACLLKRGYSSGLGRSSYRPKSETAIWETYSLFVKTAYLLNQKYFFVGIIDFDIG
jgi:hypothetical protein